MRFKEFSTPTAEQQLEHKFKQMRDHLHKLQINEAAATPPAGLAKWVTTGFKAFSAALAFVGLGTLLEPIYKYVTEMTKAEHRRDAGADGPQSEAVYNENRANQTGLLISSLAANLGVIISSALTVGLFAKLISVIPWFGPLLASAITIIGRTGNIYLMQQLQSDEGRKHIAALITVSTIKDVGEWGVAAIDWLHEKFVEAFNLDKSSVAKVNPPEEAAHPEKAPDTTPVDSTKPNRENDYMIPHIDDPQDNYTPPGYARDKSGFMTFAPLK